MSNTEQITKAILRGDETFQSTSGLYKIRLPKASSNEEAIAEAKKIVDMKVHDLYPRVCDYTNRGMWRGYTNNDTYVSIEGKKAFMDDWKLLSMDEAYASYEFYYTEWEELDNDENFTSDGVLTEFTDEMKEYIVE